MKYRALDLFCGAGGAAMGLHRAGFDVVGIDNRPQPRYPFRFIRGDALRPPVRLEDFDLVWASPPCQAHTPMSNRWRGKGTVADSRCNLLSPTRTMLASRAGLWVLENVIGSGHLMADPTKLVGEMFGLATSRPRLFDSNFYVMQPCRPVRKLGAVAIYGAADGRRLYDRTDGSQLRAWTVESGAQALGIDWMNEDGMREAIPPAYSEHIGRYAIMALDAARGEDAGD